MNIFILNTRPELKGIMAHAGRHPLEPIENRFNAKSGYKIIGTVDQEPLVVTDHTLEETRAHGEGLITGVDVFPDAEAILHGDLPEYTV